MTSISSRAQFEHAIAVLVGQPPASFTLPTAPLNLRAPAIPVALPADLLERRPDIASAERRMAEANDRVGIATAAYYPTLSISAAVGLESTAISNIANASSLLWSAGGTVSETAFDFGRRHSVVVQAKAGYDETVANYRQTTLTAFQQVEDNLAVLRVLNTEAEQQHRATEAAQRAQAIFNNRYVGGLDTYLQVVTAQQTALANERNDIDIERRQMDASVLLIKALGGRMGCKRSSPKCNRLSHNKQNRPAKTTHGGPFFCYRRCLPLTLAPALAPVVCRLPLLFAVPLALVVAVALVVAFAPLFVIPEGNLRLLLLSTHPKLCHPERSRRIPHWFLLVLSHPPKTLSS